MFDIGIIGAGPGGYTLAIRMAQKGKSVALFEKNFVGGTCLNLGCIPTKAILHSCSVLENVKNCQKFGVNAENINFDYEKIFDRKNLVVEKMRKSLEKLIKSYGIEIIYGEAVIKNQTQIECDETVYDCEKIVVSTGSTPSIPKIFLQNEYVLDSNNILNLKKLPENITIIGSGAIGIEWSRIFSTLGVQVNLIEMAENILPIADFEVSQRLERILKKNRVKIYTSNCVEKIENNTVKLQSGQEIISEKILMATGRKPVLPNSQVEYETDEKGFVIVDKNFRNKNGLYAIGDASSKIQLAHTAIHQAILLSNYLCSGEYLDDFVIPSVIYGEPEIAWVGKTEQELKGQDYKKYSYPVSALGKAQADGIIDGFVKLLSIDDELVGAHIIAPEASSLICEFILPIQKRLKVSDLTKICHPHPTYSEASFEAIMGLNGTPLNVMKGF